MEAVGIVLVPSIVVVVVVKMHISQLNASGNHIGMGAHNTHHYSLQFPIDFISRTLYFRVTTATTTTMKKKCI